MAEASRKLLECRVGQSTGYKCLKVSLCIDFDSKMSHAFIQQMLKDNCFDNMMSLFRPSKTVGKSLRSKPTSPHSRHCRDAHAESSRKPSS